MTRKSLLLVLGCFVQLASAAQYQVLPNLFHWQKPTAGKPSQTLTIDVDALRSELADAGDSPSLNAKALALPLPDGEFDTFIVYKNHLMPEKLAKKYPEIISFDAYSLNHPGELAKLDITPQGFHAMIMRPNQESVYIEHLDNGVSNQYKIYEPSRVKTDKTARCQVKSTSSHGELFNPKRPLLPFSSCELRQYRLALATTAAYTAFQGGTVQAGLAAVVTTVNRINGILERDSAITLQLVANNDLLIYTDPDTQPYTVTSDLGVLLVENQTNTDAVIGSANYDMGHLFDLSNSGGLAQLSAVCNSTIKAAAVSTSLNPVGDSFDVDYVAHEMGHQFGANHTQNNDCNRNPDTAVEPGSGSTIMSYAGICAPNVQEHNSDYYHGISLQEIGLFVSGAGDVCAVKTPIPAAPVITGTTGGITAPANTPFTLTATIQNYPGASFTWEQMDNEVTPQPPSRLAMSGPNFRSQPPAEDSTRYFPNLIDLAAGGPFTWEVLPSVARTMKFRVTARANTPGGSCNAYVDTTLATNPVAGPFKLQWPNDPGIVWPVKTQRTISWNPANTENAPINASLVDILLSLDGGQTYPTTLIANAPNTGSATFLMPVLSSSQARIMLRSQSGNFFAISANNFTIADLLLHLDKADRNPMNLKEAYILYSDLNIEPLVSYQLLGYPQGTITLDSKNQRFIIGNITTPRSLQVSIRLTFNDNTTQQSNLITIPGVL